MTAASTPNTEIWDKLKRVPPEHLKGFQRAGGFKGTAIKPMWTIHRMTEIFGPVGIGWNMTQPEFQVIGTNVYCTVGVYFAKPSKDGEYADAMRMDCPVWGVGGEALTGRGDDEAFKKAYTDALTNALKMLGAGADVHMGLWDGNKYVDEKPEPEAKPVMVAANGTPGASKAASRAPYDALVKDIRNAASVTALKDWYQSNIKAIDELPPDFVDELRVEYNDKLSELKAQVAA